LVPWKYAAQNHQQKNAEFFEKNQSAILISEDSLTPEILKVTIEGLFSDDGRKLAELRENEKKLFPSNGAQMVAKKILKYIEEK
jgi:UDP-N-acetylglucosamine:LPS N-acetylglucosamine transferase